MDRIKVEQLKKYYGPFRGLEEATFSVKEGEIFGFVGPNGAGKTTLIRLLLGLINPTSGQAQIDGYSPWNEAVEIYKEVGYLPSEAFFFPEMKVNDVIAFYRDMRKANQDRVELLCQRFDLDRTKRIRELSFGNRKKLGIVIAMMHEPKLLILDEPTTGLDPLMQQAFLDLLLEERKKGATVFLSSHILSEVEKICDRVALIREGVVSHVYDMKEINLLHQRKISVRPEIQGTLIPGLTPLEKTEEGMSYSYEGEIAPLLAFLAKQQISDITIRESSLEEMFMHFYQKEDPDHV
ncbi:MAG: ABC transporter ATP-binding protein [Candidatus Izemoplasmatales bacterium]|nr:ABC transporter ATP-binding protein [Candidatus Izemoplasmatales bacterium]